MEDFIVKAPDKSKPRKFLYKKDSKPMIVYLGDEKQYYGDGWYDSPAAYFPMKAHGVEESKMPELHQEIQEIAEMVNDDINLSAMTAKQLKKYCDKHLPGLKYKKNAGQKKMLELIKETQATVQAEEDEFLSDDNIQVS
jgi:hypothetical protein